MAPKTLNIWEAAGITQKDFHASAILIAAFCGGDGVNLSKYIAEDEKNPDSLANGLRRLELESTSASIPIEKEDLEQFAEGYEADAASLISDGVRTDVENHLRIDKFLDRAAEFASTRHGAEHVVSAGLKGYRERDLEPKFGVSSEASAPLCLLFAKNEPFSKQERVFLEMEFAQKLRAATESLSSGSQQEAHGPKDTLWQSMFEFGKRRVLKKYIPEFAAAYDKTSREIAGSHAQIIQLMAPLRAACLQAQEDPAKVAEVIIKAHELRTAELVQDSWDDNDRGGPLYKTLIWLMFLGRLRSAYNAFLNIALSIPAFRQLEVRCLPPLSPAPASLDLPNSFLKKFLAGMHVHDETSKIGMSRYKQMSKQKLHVHCEIQLLFHEAGSVEALYNYIGGSKRPCFLCGCFLAGMGMRAKPSHGSFATRWTLPVIPAKQTKREPVRSQKLEIALRATEDRVQKLFSQLTDSKKLALASAERQSSVGSTRHELRASFTDPISKLRYEQTQRQDRLTMEEIYQARFMQECDISPRRTRSCYVCEKETARACSDCDGGYFCCEEHQNCPSAGHYDYQSRGVRTCSAYPKLLLCVVCGKSSSFPCVVCRSSSYCSPHCYERDRDLHRKACADYSLLSEADDCTKREQRLVIYLPPDSPNPRVLRVPLKRDLEDGTLRRSLNLSELIAGYTDSRATGRVPAQDRNLDRTVTVFFRDDYLKTETRPNLCITTLAGATVHSWKGPFVVTRQPRKTSYDVSYLDEFEDVRLEDLSVAVGWFRTYMETRSEDPEIPGPSDLVGLRRKVVRINRDFLHETRGHRFEERWMLETDIEHEELFRCPRVSSIGQMLGFELSTFKEHTHEEAEVQSHSVNDSVIARYIGPLYLITDLTDKQWGWWPVDLDLFDDGACNLIVYAPHDVSATDVANVCQFCKDMQAVFPRAIDPTVMHPLTKEQVMAAINRKNFQKSIDRHREGRDTWTERGLAPWEV